MKRSGKGCFGCFGAVFLGLVILVFIIALFKGDDDNSTTEEKAETTTQLATEQKAETTTKQKKENPLQSGIKKYKSKKYPFITNSDLVTYAPNMEGVKVSTVAKVGDFDEDEKKIKISLTEDFMFSTFDVGERFDSYKEILKEDDCIAILGTVEKLDDYGFVGKSVNLKDCYVFAYGDDAKNYDPGKTSKKLSKYLTVTEKVANSSDVSEDDYKDLCEYLDYEDVLRNPDSYKGKYCKVSGTVNQAIEGFFNTYTIYIEDSNGNKWECLYTYKDGESHVLEDDNITVYGKCKGTTNATTLLGEQVTLPEIDVEFIN